MIGGTEAAGPPRRDGDGGDPSNEQESLQILAGAPEQRRVDWNPHVVTPAEAGVQGQRPSGYPGFPLAREMTIPVKLAML